MAQVQIDRALQLLAEIMIILGVLATAVAPMVLAIEIGEWLSSSEWPGWSVEDGLGLFGIERGEIAETPAQRLLDVLMAIPLTVAVFMIGINLFLGGLKLGDWGLERARAAEFNGSAGNDAAHSSAYALRRRGQPRHTTLPVLRPILAWCALYLARRAEARSDHGRALELMAVAADFRPLSAVEQVHLASLLLHRRRPAEARSIFHALSNQFRGSGDENVQYLACYCEAMLGMIAGDTSTVIHMSNRAGTIQCTPSLRRQFPLPGCQD
jgi:hypothetical protein